MYMYVYEYQKKKNCILNKVRVINKSKKYNNNNKTQIKKCAKLIYAKINSILTKPQFEVSFS